MLRAWLLPLALLGATVAPAHAVVPSVPQPSELVVTAVAKSVTVETKDEQKLRGSYWAPRTKKGALAPAALLVHDAGSKRGDLDAIAERLWKQGFAVLSLDLRGHGDSVAEKSDWSKANDKDKDTLWAFATRDIDAAASWLLDQESVHKTNLNLVAHGAGCALAARHALDDENVRSISLLEPPTKCHGFDLASDIYELGGLPTMIMAPKKKKSPTEKMVKEANASFGDEPYVVLMNVKSKVKVLEDKKTPSKVATWLKSQANPSSK